MSARKSEGRKSSARSGGGGGGGTAVVVGVGIVVILLARNQARLAPVLTRAQHAIAGVMPTLIRYALLAAVLAAVVAAVRAHRGRAHTAQVELGRKHLAALRAVGLAKATTDGDGTPVVITPHRTVDEDGEHITYALPEGTSVGQVLATKDQFPAALRLPSNAIVSAHQGLAYHLRITTPPPALVLATRHPQLGGVTSWSNPIVIGRDTRTGVDVTAPTWNVPAWLVGGRSGSGKSVALRLLIGHYASDPDAILWGFDAKGSTDDWADILPRFGRWVATTGDTVVDGQLLIATLRDLDAQVFTRNAARGRDYPGMLVLLEEITALRDDMNPKDRAALDGLLGRLVKMCRSANVTLVITAQRPSARDLPTTVRAQAEVLLCMRMTRASDASMVLGEQPPYDVSAFPDGQGLISVKGDLRPVIVDHVDDAAWVRFCRGLPPSSGVGKRQVPAVEEVEAPDLQDAPRTLLETCVDIVTAQDDRAMTPTALFDALPDSLRPATQRALGVALTEHGWRSEINVRVGGAFVRAYRARPVSQQVTEPVSQDYRNPGPHPSDKPATCTDEVSQARARRRKRQTQAS